jgi:2-keto-3-deoxy-L-rhamnonate aldolase RhmA
MSAMTDPTHLKPAPGIIDLRARLAAGETLYGTFVGLGSPAATELIARAGFDWLILDLEHGAGTEVELLASLYAVGATPTAALVRPSSGERLRIGRALDLGAHGIMVPRVDLPEQAREAIAYMRYPPDGTRGLALSTRGAGLGELGHADVRAINERILGVIQIESPSAVEHAAEIAAIDGADVLFVGPTDLSHSLGVPGRFDDPSYLAALATVVDATERAGKAAGILLRDSTVLPRYRELGFRFIGLGSDSAFIADGARAVLRGTRG